MRDKEQAKGREGGGSEENRNGKLVVGVSRTSARKRRCVERRTNARKRRCAESRERKIVKETSTKSCLAHGETRDKRRGQKMVDRKKRETRS